MTTKSFSDRLLGRSECDGKCRIHKTWKPIVEKIEDMLENTTIDAVI